MVTLSRRKKKQKKGKIIPYSNEEVEYYIYNNMDLPYYNDDNEWENYKIGRLLLDGEQAKLIDGVYSGVHYITNYGRIINAKMVRWLTVNDVRGKYLIFHCEGKRWYLKKAMNKVGYKYDYDTITKFYKKIDYKWNTLRKT